MVSKKVRDIWIVELRDIVGHEQSGRRPAIILAVSNNVKLAIIIPFTSQNDAGRLPYTWYIKKSKKNGLTHDSIAMIFQTRSLSFARFQNKIGTLESDLFKSIKLLLKKYLDL